jgi:hypothetical protein
MSLTRQESYWHGFYEESEESTRDAIDAEFYAARCHLNASGFVTANDDRAEAVISALVRYIVESKESTMPDAPKTQADYELRLISFMRGTRL